MKTHFFLASFLLYAVFPGGTAQAGPRAVPAPLANHPGNIFLLGETVTVPAPANATGEWRLTDYEDRALASVRPAQGRFTLGPLPAGFYRLRQGTGNEISLAVIHRLPAATPLTSPIALDVAMAWFYGKDRMDAVANLCALAGVNWVRDRLSWGEMEPKPAQWSGPNRYDDSARAQAGAGLQVLQVNHMSPAWANPVARRFPLDLRDAFRFQREMARRWPGQVLAFEPWNEADIAVFGGHTGAEMASLQKAAYLGLKAGNPNVLACLNVFALHNRAQLDDLHDNEAWPYFETFNLHHYQPFANYPKLYADFRSVSAGRPLWVTECAIPVPWAGDPKRQEPTEASLQAQSERLVQVFAGSLHEGAAATFYFLFPHYVEGQIQFGIVRPDLTPRPAYVALAAVGRFLADARPLGRVQTKEEKVQAYLFSARPDGSKREVLLAWTTSGPGTLALPLEPVSVFDHLGRQRPTKIALPLTTAPQFVVLSEGSARRLSLQAPPAAPAPLPGKPCSVVMQALWPEAKVALGQSAYRLSTDQAQVVPVFVYNFGEVPAVGSFKVSATQGWRAQLSPATVKVDPQGRAELRLVLDGRQATTDLPATVRVTGGFGAVGKPVLSVRFLKSVVARRN